MKLQRAPLWSVNYALVEKKLNAIVNYYRVFVQLLGICARYLM